MTAPRPDRRRRPLRTGVVATAPPASPGEWRDRVRRIDEQGHDVLLTADHIGNTPPLPPLVAAAAASDRLRFGTQVLNNGFWNPVLLARDAAAVDVLTGGRLELGFGAGHTATEFAAAGIPYPPPAARIDRLAEAVPVVRRLLAGERVDAAGTYRLDAAELGFAAVQRPVPIMIGGNGDRLLRLAAAEADIVGLVGFTAGTGRVHTDLSHFTWHGLADRIDHVRRHAGERFDRLELSVLVQGVAVTGDRERTAVDFARGMIDDVAPLLDSPFLLLGTEAELAEQVRRLCDAGVTYVTTFEHASEALAVAAAPVR
ncbi:MAG TPA: TIGR03621 family F420-dependent LLM class oxidoreductase [Acidimicrobiales bacterium]